MDEVPPALPIIRREPLLRGPLILTAISRVLMVPFYLVLALRSSIELKRLPGYYSSYIPLYIADKFALVGSMWSLLLLSLVLVWLFFARRRMFRPLMIYFSLLLPLLFICVGAHITHFQRRHRGHPKNDPSALYLGCTMLGTVAVWPFYYVFSPRVKRVFTR